MESDWIRVGSLSLTAQILEQAIAEVDKNGSKSDVKIGPYSADNGLRDGLEATYRELAGIETDQQHRYLLVVKPTPCEGGLCDD